METTSAPGTPTPHDALFKKTFSIPENAMSELAFLLPEPLKQALDLRQLSFKDGSFVDEALRASSSDLLFQVPLRRSPERSVLIYALYEHLSTHPPGHLFPLRLLRYMVRIWKQVEQEQPHTKTLPIILPLVLYHGEREWQCGSHFGGLFDLSEPALEAFVPNFSFLLDDISHTSDEALRTRDMLTHAKAALWFLKHARSGAKLLQKLGTWRHELLQLQETERGEEALLTLFLYYVMVGKEIEWSQVREAVVHTLGPQTEETMLTLGERLIQQGEARGEARGKAEGEATALFTIVEAKGWELSDRWRQRVAECTDLSMLEEWVRKAVTATSLDQVFATP